MITCPNCGKQVPAGSKFCTFCGFDLAGVSQEPTQPTAADQAQPAVNATQPVQPQDAPAQPQPAAQPQAPQDDAQPQQPESQPAQQPEAQPQRPTGQAQYQQQAPQQSDQSQYQQQAAQPQQQAPQGQSQPNPTADATKQYAAGYWAYLVAGFKHPNTITQRYHKYFGLTSLIITAVIMGLASVIMSSRMTSSITGTSAGSTGFKTFVESALIYFALLVIFASVSYLVKYSFFGDTSSTYLDTVNDFAHFGALMVIISVLAVLYALVGTVSAQYSIVMFALLMLVFALAGIAYTAIVFNAQVQKNFDRIYAYICGHVILVIALVLFFRLLYSMAASSATDTGEIGSLFN